MGALLSSSCTNTVTGYDLNEDSVASFHSCAIEAKKAIYSPPKSLEEAVSSANVVVLCLVNEQQCESVCFSSDNACLAKLLPKNACIIITSTVTASWCRSASSRFTACGIYCMDCPVSGGPARAKEGDLTLMASECECLPKVSPLLKALAREVHILKGGVGMGS